MTLADWDDRLTFEEIRDTVYIVDLFIRNPENFNKKESKQVLSWLKYNDLVKFKQHENQAKMLQHEFDIVKKFATELNRIELPKRYISH